MYVLQRLGRYSLDVVQRRRIFMSYLVCRDDLNNLIIVGCRSPYLLTYNQPFLTAYKEEKRSMSSAIRQAYKRGELVPRQKDLKYNKQIRLKIVDHFGLNVNAPLEVYLYNA